jgi:hypothetical protein
MREVDPLIQVEIYEMRMRGRYSIRYIWLMRGATIRNNVVQSVGAAVASVPWFSRSGMTPRANRRSKAMPKSSKKKRTADEIAEMASRGEDISAYFSNKFTVVRPVRRVNVDLTHGMLRAVIEMLLGRALNEERENKLRSKALTMRRSGKKFL